LAIDRDVGKQVIETKNKNNRQEINQTLNYEAKKRETCLFLLGFL
jgi:hypothetical protein